jgi:hypothetical protein
MSYLKGWCIHSSSCVELLCVSFLLCGSVQEGYIIYTVRTPYIHRTIVYKSTSLIRNSLLEGVQIQEQGGG